MRNIIGLCHFIIILSYWGNNHVLSYETTVPIMLWVVQVGSIMLQWREL